MNTHSMQRWGKLRSIYQTLRTDKPGDQMWAHAGATEHTGWRKKFLTCFSHATAVRRKMKRIIFAPSFVGMKFWAQKGRIDGDVVEIISLLFGKPTKGIFPSLSRNGIWRRARGRLSVFMRRFLPLSPLRGRMKCDLAVSSSIFIVIGKFGKVDVECQLIESVIDRKLSSSHVTA